MKHKTIVALVEPIMNVIHETNDDDRVREAIEFAIKEAYNRGYNNRIRNETRWPT